MYNLVIFKIIIIGRNQIEGFESDCSNFNTILSQEIKQQLSNKKSKQTI